jgi:hypothetical protein
MPSPRDLFFQIKAAAKGLAAKLRPRQTAMVGTPPSQRPLWHDPAAHARDFAERFAQDLDLAVAERMGELGLHDDQIGRPDSIAGIQWAAFHPHGIEGGNNSPSGRLIVDSGLLNLELLRKDYGKKAAKLFAKSRLRDRLDAIIAHEYEEYRHGMDHEAALRAAPRTALPITERAREIAKAMEKGWKGR